eukprot:CAMPEP_0173082274 /NCGR_PEP_ID=MMETSP1102-20130122/18105_1 /TAXON_ID=49646 /ORGANISM="Geminigera sp., Strain Caron Lab Isolate" /LENGTH=81 /DNA_ID=CAMNT_0013957683 /DNA_START=830 /DNA_END=1071 /DNA_ORIENTATION=-
MLTSLNDALTAGDGLTHVDARNGSTTHLVRPALLRLLTTAARDELGDCSVLLALRLSVLALLRVLHVVVSVDALLRLLTTA